MGETNNGGAAGARLRSFIERIENLKEEQKELGRDISAIFDEAKGEGYNIKVIRRILQMRQISEIELESFEEEYDLYKHHLGMVGGREREQKSFDDTPLGTAAAAAPDEPEAPRKPARGAGRCRHGQSRGL